MDSNEILWLANQERTRKLWEEQESQLKRLWEANEIRNERRFNDSACI